MRTNTTGIPAGREPGALRQKWGMLAAGIAFLTLGILAPVFLNVENFQIYAILDKALGQWEKIYVLLAALNLVALNTLRAIPHYLGAFFLAEAINETRDSHWSPLSMMVIFVTIPGVYFIIEQLYGIHYDLGIPAVSMIVTTLIFSRIRFDFVNLTKKVLMMSMMIVALQFLDIMPLAVELPIGRGESSVDIKLTSQMLGADAFLRGMASVCCVLFLAVGVLLVVLIHDENNIKRISEEKEQSEHALMENQLRVLENRTYMELNHLVHDLKSPLTSMQTLVGVVKMSCESNENDPNVHFLELIESGIERMSNMISEILYEDRRTETTTQRIIKGVLAQASAAEYAELIRADNRLPEGVVAVNVIRFTRALINLLENSFYAVDRETGIIWLEVYADPTQEAVCFEVRDNGSGIEEQHLEQILTSGFSTRNSSGLGLSFARTVVEQSGGRMDIHSVAGEGTQVTITIPACVREEDPQEPVPSDSVS